MVCCGGAVAKIALANAVPPINGVRSTDKTVGSQILICSDLVLVYHLVLRPQVCFVEPRYVSTAELADSAESRQHEVLETTPRRPAGGPLVISH